MAGWTWAGPMPFSKPRPSTRGVSMCWSRSTAGPRDIKWAASLFARHRCRSSLWEATTRRGHPTWITSSLTPSPPRQSSPRSTARSSSTHLTPSSSTSTRSHGDISSPPKDLPESVRVCRTRALSLPTSTSCSRSIQPHSPHGCASSRPPPTRFCGCCVCRLGPRSTFVRPHDHMVSTTHGSSSRTEATGVTTSRSRRTRISP
mmetsp:Transcript_63093/g.137164  ORF Transcript_63093/g.137164 Transcript_63093/m.137164 type:complete len:203 (+) Transcript_63093:149-757(+)